MQAHSVQRYSDDQGSLEVLYGVHIHLVVEGLGQICWSLGDAVCGRLWPFTDGGERLRLLTLNGAADWERWNTHRLPIGWLWVERLSITDMNVSYWLLMSRTPVSPVWGPLAGSESGVYREWSWGLQVTCHPRVRETAQLELLNHIFKSYFKYYVI